jgi:hypothetical protein
VLRQESGAERKQTHSQSMARLPLGLWRLTLQMKLASEPPCTQTNISMFIVNLLKLLLIQCSRVNQQELLFAQRFLTSLDKPTGCTGGLLCCWYRGKQPTCKRPQHNCLTVFCGPLYSIQWFLVMNRLCAAVGGQNALEPWRHCPS